MPGAQAIRIGENAIFRLSGRVVIRVARPGQLVVAAKEIRIARWLAHHDVPAIRALEGVPQPLEITGRAVTFWEELPPHRHGTPAEVADALRRLHDLPVPTEFTLAPLARMTCYLAQHATEHPCARSEAELRVACLRGDHGPRPWDWTPAP